VTNTLPPQSDTAGLAAGLQIPGYRLEQQIGRGGMAAVFRAHDERLDRQVALKVLVPALAQDDAFRLRFIAESRAAAAVEDPHIIPVYEAGEAGGVLFIAMRLVRGGDLRTLVAQHGPLAPARAAWILSAVASALDAAHTAGLVHRDVKPANMLLDVRPGRPDHVYLSDFGVSKASVASGLTGSGQFIGTVDYAAPEQIHGQPVDGRTDQYSLGCSAFELLCGHPPFFGKQWLAAMYSHVSEPPPIATSLRDELPAAVDSVFARVLAKSPADRYETCEEFATALRAALRVQPYASDEHASPGQLKAADAEGDATLDPSAMERFAFRIRVPAEAVDAAATGNVGAALGAVSLDTGAVGSAAGASTDPRATTQLTVDGSRNGRPQAGGPAAKRSRRFVFGVLAAVVALAAAAAGALLALARTPAPAHSARYQFAMQFGHGLSITQLWTLAGPGGSSLEVTMTVSNATRKAVIALLAEPVPAAVAPDPSMMTFTGLVKPASTGRLVVWDDLQLARESKAVVRYQVPEAASGVSQARLMYWINAYLAVSPQQALQLVTHRGLLLTVWIKPLNLRLSVGQSDRLEVLARLRNHELAPRADLTGAVWTTTNPAVLVVNRGKVTAISPGSAVIWVQLGGIRASATVMVIGPAGQIPVPPYSQPPVQQSTSASPTGPTPTSGSPTPTSPTPTSGSSTPGTPPPSSTPSPSAG
jgi:hypothetical protein